MVHSITNKIAGVSFLLIVFSFLVQSCSHVDELAKNGLESTSDESSHNSGRNCMSCHHDAKDEASQKWWYVAGTAYNSNLSPASAGGTVELWTEPNRTGQLLYTLTIDRSGNFYTQKIVDFKGGFYPVLVSNGGSKEEMTTKITEGACNSCHGVSEPVIYFN